MNKKYSQEQTITLDAVLAAGISLTTNQIRDWADAFGFFEVVDWAKSISFRRFCHKNVITPALAAKGFIKEIQPKTYKIGQYFERGNIPYILASLDGKKAGFINMTSGQRWSAGVAVENLYNINEVEFNAMQGSGMFGTFTEIKVKVTIEK